MPEWLKPFWYSSNELAMLEWLKPLSLKFSNCMAVQEWLKPFWHGHVYACSNAVTKFNATVRSRMARATLHAWHLNGCARTARAILPKPCSYYTRVPKWLKPFLHEVMPAVLEWLEPLRHGNLLFLSAIMHGMHSNIIGMRCQNGSS